MAYASRPDRRAFLGEVGGGLLLTARITGASPGDLPIELPNCDLAINRDAAKAPGVAIPPSLRAELIWLSVATHAWGIPLC